MIGLGLSVVQLAIQQAYGAFSPLTLFAANEPGVWYDPSDMSTMFQDAAGSTPVTAVEQPVGLMLDKSRGLVLGPELVTNGDFSSGTTGWSPASASLSVASGELVLTTTVNSSYPKAYRAFSCVVGKTYKVSATARVISSPARAGVSLVNSDGVFAGLEASTASRTNATVQFVFTATSTTHYVAASASGATPAATGNTFAFDNISVRELPGNHATQPTATARPVLKIDGNGKHYLRFDGVDDFLVTNTITPGTDKVQVFAGVRKLSDVVAIVAELSPNVNVNAGSFYLVSGADVGGTYTALGRGSAGGASTVAKWVPSNLAPDTAVLSATHDIAGDLSTIRRNGINGTSATGDQGAGNFLAYPLYIGRRGGTSLPFNGHLYSMIVRFGPNLSNNQITQTENWVNSKTGAY